MGRYPVGFEARFDLRREATPKPLLVRPVHRWFVFPHSFGAGLVDEITDRWGLADGATVLDPFAGAGTTLRAARERGMDAHGTDISPLSVLVSRTKVGRYDSARLERIRRRLRVRPSRIEAADGAPALLRKALGSAALGEAKALLESISRIGRRGERDFFLLALLRAARSVSRAVSDGGWLRWTDRRPRDGALLRVFDARVDEMIRDLSEAPRGSGSQRIHLGDARELSPNGVRFDGVITSPPYPNRHDYSRVFAVELLLAFLDEKGLFRLRYDSLRSHVEARPKARAGGYRPPPVLEKALRVLDRAPVTDRRVIPMVEGYFEDMWTHLRATRPLLRRGGRLAYVVGNVRHAGVMIPVDEILLDLGRAAGYRPEGAWVVRERGNSAQQMEAFGREPARESVVFLRRP